MTNVTLRHLDLDSLVLKSGSHTPDGEFCLMEAVAFVAGERWSDHPECASPVLGAFGRALNDRFRDDERQLLKPFIPRLMGTRGSAEVERSRAYMLADWAVRTVLPLALEGRKLGEWSERLRELPELVDAASARSGRDLARRAAYAADAADAADAARQPYVAAAVVMLDRMLS